MTMLVHDYACVHAPEAPCTATLQSVSSPIKSSTVTMHFTGSADA